MSRYLISNTLAEEELKGGMTCFRYIISAIERSRFIFIWHFIAAFNNVKFYSYFLGILNKYTVDMLIGVIKRKK